MADDKGWHTRPNQLHAAWFIWTSMLSMLAVFLLICHFWGDHIRAATESQASVIRLRTIFYMIALATFPTINLLRRKMLQYPSHRRRRNAEDLKSSSYDRYYLGTVTLSLALAESIGVWGFALFILGDSLQTLYLFCGISALAMVLYRPKMDELKQLGGCPRIN